MHRRAKRWSAPLICTLSFLTIGFGGSAWSAEPPPRPGYGVPQEHIKKYEDLRLRRQVPSRSRPEVTPAPTRRRRYLEADLVRYEDGVVVVARRLSRKSVKRLQRLGVPTVTRIEDLRDSVMFDDRLYRVLPVSPTKKACQGCPEGHLSGPDPVLLERRLGQRVRLELARSLAGQTVVVAVTTSSE